MADLDWPGAAGRLVTELAASPGRLALVASAGVGQGLQPLSEALKIPVVSAGQLLTAGPEPPSRDIVRAALGSAQLIDDAEVLFAPELNMDPLVLLREIARRHPVVLLWPGKIQGVEATFSELGRHDFYQRRLRDAVILHPVDHVFPDQSPYRFERVS
jgi:hypothetical protein